MFFLISNRRVPPKCLLEPIQRLMMMNAFEFLVPPTGTGNTILPFPADIRGVLKMGYPQVTIGFNTNVV